MGLVQHRENKHEYFLSFFFHCSSHSRVSGEGIYHAKSGREVNVLMTTSDLKDAEGNITGNLALIKDITERKKTENEIIKANKRFSTIFNFSPVAIAITNLQEGRFIYLNDEQSKPAAKKKVYKI